MIKLEINKGEYFIPELWDELLLDRMLIISNVCAEIPDDLRIGYERSIEKIKDSELKDEKEAEIDLKSAQLFFQKVVAALTQAPFEVILSVNEIDLIATYKQYCEQFVIGCVFGIIDYKPMRLMSFEHEGQRYFLPETKTILGVERPFYDRTAIEFTECVDLINAGKAEKNAFKYANVIMSILCRELAAPYDEANIDEETFKSVSMAHVLDVYRIIEDALMFVQTSHPTLFDSGGNRVKSIKALNNSGLKDYGWFASIVSCCNSLTDLENVKQSNFHDWIMYLAVKTAEQKFKNQ